MTTVGSSALPSQAYKRQITSQSTRSANVAASSRQIRAGACSNPEGPGVERSRLRKSFLALSIQARFSSQVQRGASYPPKPTIAVEVDIGGRLAYCPNQVKICNDDDRNE